MSVGNSYSADSTQREAKQAEKWSPNSGCTRQPESESCARPTKTTTRQTRRKPRLSRDVSDTSARESGMTLQENKRRGGWREHEQSALAPASARKKKQASTSRAVTEVHFTFECDQQLTV